MLTGLIIFLNRKTLPMYSNVQYNTYIVRYSSSPQHIARQTCRWQSYCSRQICRDVQSWVVTKTGSTTRRPQCQKANSRLHRRSDTSRPTPLHRFSIVVDAMRHSAEANSAPHTGVGNRELAIGIARDLCRALKRYGVVAFEK